MYTLAGAPGSGKSTQAHILADEAGFVIVSAGQLLREKAPEAIKLAMQRGELADNRYTNTLMAEALDDHIQTLGSDKIILDGYPRMKEQACWLVEEYGAKITRYIYLTAPDDVLIGRLNQRHRADDNEEAIICRLNLYRQNIEHVLGYFRSLGVIIHEIDASRDEEVIAQEIKGVFRNV